MVDERFDELLHTLCADYRVHNNLNLEARTNSNIKRGLRNDDGTGVMVGCTAVGNVLGYTIEDGERVPMPGRLIYRGYDLSDLVDGYIREQRFGFPEVAYLLLFGHLPDQEQYDMFKRLLHDFTDLPQNFTEDMILKNPSHNVMNKLGRSVLALYSCDPDPDSLSVENMMRQSIELIARFPVIASYAYVVKRHYFDNDSLYLHRPEPELSTAENFLRMIRPDKHFTQEEARLLDLCLVCHAEHGGGNNSTFTCRSVSSTGTDTYSAIAAAVGSLKGPKHGGANRQVLAQFSLIKQTVRDWKDDDAVADCVGRILRRELGDGSGLIYGMGHAVYSLSDPRANLLHSFVEKLSREKGRTEEYELYSLVERLGPEIIAGERKMYKGVSANVDFYSGFVYHMLDLPLELYTPLFAMARVAGWSAHRIEELINMGKIIRPAYKYVGTHADYAPLAERCPQIHPKEVCAEKKFTLVKGVPERLEVYREFFYGSKLYDAYFAEGDSLNENLLRAMADGDLYVAMSPGDEAVGVMYMTRNGLAGLPYLNLLGVKKKYRDQGIGTDLVKIFIGVMEEKNYPNMFIMTSQFNTGAKRLYQSLGFQPKCLLHDVIRKGVSEWLFMRPNRKLA